jgi:hypothetical protein
MNTTRCIVGFSPRETLTVRSRKSMYCTSRIEWKGTASQVVAETVPWHGGGMDCSGSRPWPLTFGDRSASPQRAGGHPTAGRRSRACGDQNPHWWPDGRLQRSASTMRV